MEAAEDEYKLRVSELQSDVVNLRESLEKNVALAKQFEREKSQLVTDLTEQNQRLASQLKEAGDSERELREEIGRLRDNFRYKKSSMQVRYGENKKFPQLKLFPIQEHFQQVEQLREEILEVTQRKESLESRIGQLVGERQNLSYTLDDSTDRILLMEKRHREQVNYAKHIKTGINS